MYLSWRGDDAPLQSDTRLENKSLFFVISLNQTFRSYSFQLVCGSNRTYMTTYLNIHFAFTLSRRIRTSAHPLLSTAHMKFPLKDRTPFQIASQRMSTNAAKIPVIDISAPDVDQKDVARQLVDAAEEHGFIYIRNLGRDISAADIDGAFELVSKTHWKAKNPITQYV